MTTKRTDTRALAGSILKAVILPLVSVGHTDSETESHEGNDFFTLATVTEINAASQEAFPEVFEHLSSPHKTFATAMKRLKEEGDVFFDLGGHNPHRRVMLNVKHLPSPKSIPKADQKKKFQRDHPKGYRLAKSIQTDRGVRGKLLTSARRLRGVSEDGVVPDDGMFFAGTRGKLDAGIMTALGVSLFSLNSSYARQTEDGLLQLRGPTSKNRQVWVKAPKSWFKPDDADGVAGASSEVSSDMVAVGEAHHIMSEVMHLCGWAQPAKKDHRIRSQNHLSELDVAYRDGTPRQMNAVWYVRTTLTDEEMNQLLSEDDLKVWEAFCEIAKNGVPDRNEVETAEEVEEAVVSVVPKAEDFPNPMIAAEEGLTATLVAYHRWIEILDIEIVGLESHLQALRKDREDLLEKIEKVEDLLPKAES